MFLCFYIEVTHNSLRYVLLRENGLFNCQRIDKLELFLTNTVDG
jgi:hypothetical protein